MAPVKARLRSQQFRRWIALVGGVVVFGLVLAAIWFFGSDHQDWAVKDGPLPPPQQIKVNEQGVQEFTLVVTPGGYNPAHFAVKKGLPVKLTFRQLGQVGCANTLIFPVAPGMTSTLTLKSATDRQSLEFTPPQAGQFQFTCPDEMHRGIMMVTE